MSIHDMLVQVHDHKISRCEVWHNDAGERDFLLKISHLTGPGH